jgi:hypothetical protein
MTEIPRTPRLMIKIYFSRRSAGPGRPGHASRRGDGSREQRLLREIGRGGVTLELEWSESPLGPWLPLVSIKLERAASLDGAALHFRPFRDGRGMRPHGFIHALRRGVYAASQRARPG